MCESRDLPPSFPDAQHSRVSGTRHLLSSTLQGCSPTTRDQLGATSLIAVSNAVIEHSRRVLLTDAEDDLWRTVVPSANDRRMILIVESRAPKINKVDLWAQKHPPELGGSGRQRARRRNVPVVREGLICVTDEEDVLGFQVGVDEVEVV